MKAFRTLILTMSLTVFLAPPAKGAQPKQAVAEPTGLALEIIYAKDLPPAYQSVPPSDGKLAGVWFARFRRVPDWLSPQGALPVRAVNIVSRKEGDAVRINVSVLVGLKFPDQEEPVATYLVQENQKFTTTELTRLGVEPFEIKVVRVTPAIPVLPSVINNAPSILVEGIEANNSTLPSYKLSLRNASRKPVIGLQIDVLVDGKARLLSQPMGKEGQPLIRAAGELQTNVAGVKDARVTQQGYAPESPREQQIVIGTAVFEDGSYEGNSQIAAQIRVRIIAHKLRLEQIVRILESLKEESANGQSALAALRKQVSSLKDNPVMNDGASMEGISQIKLAEKNQLNLCFQAALHQVKKALLDEIDRFEKSFNESPDKKVFETWLSAITNKYEQWLSRL